MRRRSGWRGRPLRRRWRGQGDPHGDVAHAPYSQASPGTDSSCEGSASGVGDCGELWNIQTTYYKLRSVYSLINKLSANKTLETRKCVYLQLVINISNLLSGELRFSEIP